MKENDPIIPSSYNMHVEIAQTPYPNINYKANQNIIHENNQNSATFVNVTHKVDHCSICIALLHLFCL